jgi:intracellular sulfur oxidation DsrE/DsrF family protein
MENNDFTHTSGRRDFLGTVATGAAAMSLGALFAPFTAGAEKNFKKQAEDADAWFAKIKGKHRMIFDVTAPHEMFPFAWPKVFLLTNAATGTPEKESTAVVVLRHSAIPYAMGDALWTKYKFGEVFKIDDPATKAPSIRNPFWKPNPGDFKIPGIGNVDIGIDQLQEAGVMFCVCDVALTVNSAVIAMKSNQDAATVKKEFLSELLPGIQVVPSGVWGVGRAQEHGCGYCFVG